MKFNKEKIIESLNLHPFGAKNWLSNKSIPCPICGKSDKFGILFTNSGGVTHCFYECGENLSLYKFLKSIYRDDLIDFNKDINIEKTVNTDILEKLNQEVSFEMPEKRKVFGYKRIFEDKYLRERNFTDYQFNLFEVGVTKLDPSLKEDYIIFPLIRDNKWVGYISRSKKSKKWHDKNIEDSKEGLCKLQLRYDNSLETEFNKYLYGEHEINENTHTIILVEGIFSKFAVDRNLDLYSSDEIKCCACFGQKVSDEQMKLLQDKGVKNVILLFDNGTYESTSKYSLRLSSYFHTQIAYIKQKGKDPDEITKDELIEVFNNLQTPHQFTHNKIQPKKLL